jgi:hypothetical protein
MAFKAILEYCVHKVSESKPSFLIVVLEVVLIVLAARCVAMVEMIYAIIGIGKGILILSGNTDTGESDIRMITVLSFGFHKRRFSI